MQYVRGVFLSQMIPTDHCSKSSVVVDDPAPGPPREPWEGVGPRLSPACVWGPRSPNPQVRDVKGGATPPLRCVDLSDVRLERPIIPFPFSPARDLSVGKAQRKRGESKAAVSSLNLERHLPGFARPSHTHLPVRIAGHGDFDVTCRLGRGFSVSGPPPPCWWGRAAFDLIAATVNPVHLGRRK